MLYPATAARIPRTRGVFARKLLPRQNQTEPQPKIDLSVTSRNVVTRGVRLNDLVGREFLVGSLRFRGAELCEPCLGLGEALATADLPPPSVVKRWLRKGGLRAVALSTGELSVGAKFANAA